jgi:hypothetical protein
MSIVKNNEFIPVNSYICTNIHTQYLGLSRMRVVEDLTPPKKKSEHWQKKMNKNVARLSKAVHLYIYIHIYIYIHTYIHTNKHTYVHTYIHTYIHIYIHAHTHTHTHTHTHAHTRVCVHACMYVCIYIHTHTALSSLVPRRASCPK